MLAAFSPLIIGGQFETTILGMHCPVEPSQVRLQIPGQLSPVKIRVCCFGPGRDAVICRTDDRLGSCR